MFLAAIDANGIAVVISALCIGAVQIIVAWKANAAAKEVKQQLKETTVAQEKKIDDLEETAEKRVAEVKEEITKNVTVTGSKLQEVVSAANARADSVREVLSTYTGKTQAKLDLLLKTGEATHKAVNGNMNVQLKLHAGTTRRLAQITKDPEDIKAAEQAEETYVAHKGQVEKDAIQELAVARAKVTMSSTALDDAMAQAIAQAANPFGDAKQDPAAIKSALLAASHVLAEEPVRQEAIDDVLPVIIPLVPPVKPAVELPIPDTSPGPDLPPPSDPAA